MVMGTVAVVENPPPVSGCGGGLGSPADANVGGLTVRVVAFVMQLEDGKRVTDTWDTTQSRLLTGVFRPLSVRN